MEGVGPPGSARMDQAWEDWGIGGGGVVRGIPPGSPEKGGGGGNIPTRPPPVGGPRPGKWPFGTGGGGGGPGFKPPGPRRMRVEKEAKANGVEKGWSETGNGQFRKGPVAVRRIGPARRSRPTRGRRGPASDGGSGERRPQPKEGGGIRAKGLGLGAPRPRRWRWRWRRPFRAGRREPLGWHPPALFVQAVDVVELAADRPAPINHPRAHVHRLPLTHPLAAVEAGRVVGSCTRAGKTAGDRVDVRARFGGRPVPHARGAAAGRPLGGRRVDRRARTREAPRVHQSRARAGVAVRLCRSSAAPPPRRRGHRRLIDEAVVHSIILHHRVNPQPSTNPAC